MEQMEDNLSNMQRNVVLVRERKSKLEVRSTIDGELGLLDVALGQSITPGQTIGQVNDLSDFKIEAMAKRTTFLFVRFILRFAKASSAQIWCSVATALAISALGKPIT